MPHWNCETCGARLYSASKQLRRQSCPVCQGRLAPLGDPPPRFGREARAGERAKADVPPGARPVDAGPA